MKKLYVLGIAALLLSSCEKPEGTGGNSTISGKVWLENYNTLNDQWDTYELKDEYAAEDEDVFIIYGDEIGFGQKVTTGPDGKFEFRYLRPGDYRIYVDSKDTTRTSVSGRMAVETKVTLGKKDNKDVGTILIFK
jgi:hypothetical protein